MTKAEMVKEIIACGVVFVNETPMSWAKRTSKANIQRMLDWAHEFQRAQAES